MNYLHYIQISIIVKKVYKHTNQIFDRKIKYIILIIFFQNKCCFLMHAKTLGCFNV